MPGYELVCQPDPIDQDELSVNAHCALRQAGVKVDLAKTLVSYQWSYVLAPATAVRVDVTPQAADAPWHVAYTIAANALEPLRAAAAGFQAVLEYQRTAASTPSSLNAPLPPAATDAETFKDVDTAVRATETGYRVSETWRVWAGGDVSAILLIENLGNAAVTCSGEFSTIARNVENSVVRPVKAPLAATVVAAGAQRRVAHRFQKSEVEAGFSFTFPNETTFACK